MTAKNLDVVRLKDGRTATVLETFDGGAAYLVEIADATGKPLDMPTVKADEIVEVVWHS